MKTHLTLFLLVLALLGWSNANAKIWRINNTPGAKADFTNPQPAHDGASSGDTLHIEGSQNNYSDLTVTKPLVIIGNGYFLGENGELQANRLTSTINQLFFNAGSAGSTVMGMTLINLFVRTSNIVVSRNRVTTYLFLDISSPASNILVNQNYLNVMQQNNAQSVSDLLITNNYFGGPVSFPASFIPLLQNNIFSNNVNVHNATLTNNIMREGTFTPNNSTFTNNVGNATQFGTANNNKSNVNMGDVFVGATGNSTDGQYKLKQNSPASGAGAGGTDAGMFGGTKPYVLSGIPPVPAIYSFTVPATGSNTTPLNVVLKVRSNP
jgi:hypothetical protein